LLQWYFAMWLFRIFVRTVFSKPKAKYRYYPPPHIREKATPPKAVTLTRGQIVAVPPPQAALVGKCWVIDGDTIKIGGTRIRLAGIDAPELDHPFGQNAKWTLINLCRGLSVKAVFEAGMSYDRTVATCYLPDGRDLSAEMVKAGMAIDWRKFSGGKYRHLEPFGVRKKLWRCDARQKGRMPQSMPD